MTNHRYIMTRARHPGFVPLSHDVHGVAWLPGEPHPGGSIFEGNEFIEYVDYVDYNRKAVTMTNMSDEKMKENYTKALKSNPNLTFDDYVDMQKKQAAQKAQKQRDRDNRPTKPSSNIINNETNIDDIVTLSIDEADKLADPVDPSELKSFQELMQSTHIKENFHTALKTYAESLWGPFNGIDPAFESSIKDFAIKKWGPFASDVPKNVDTVDVEELVEKVYSREDAFDSINNLNDVYVLRWNWEYGNESREFNSLKEASDYPAYVISFFSEFDFSEAGWKIFKRQQTTDVEIPVDFKLTSNEESKKNV